MRSYTTLRNLYGQFTNNTSTENLAIGDGYINDSIRTIATKRTGKWTWLEATKTVATVASQTQYQIPNPIRKVVSLTITVSTMPYTPTPIYDPNAWNRILESRLGSSDVPLFYYIYDGKVDIQPIPATNGNTITFRGRINLKDLSIADYTTGTIVSIANGATAVVGSGTTWTADMVGRYIRIAETSAANGGDNEWYEIGSYTSATSIGLLKPYQGTSIVAGTATYTIGQMSPIPESYDILPVYRAAALYWDNQRDSNQAKSYWLKYDGGMEAGLSRQIGGLMAQMIDEASATVEGAYISPNQISGRFDPNNPEPTVGAGSFI